MIFQIESLQPRKQINKVIIANFIIMLIFLFIPYTEPLAKISSFLQHKISSTCTVGPWFTPQQALSISASMTFSILTAVFFYFFGDFNKEEMKRERNGMSVIFVLTLVLAFTFYIVVFYIPCGLQANSGTTTGKAALGEGMFYYVRTNSFIFTIFISLFCGFFSYGAALVLKLISNTKINFSG